MEKRLKHLPRTKICYLCVIALLFLTTGTEGDESSQHCTQCCTDICTDIDCVNEAVTIEALMNASADPCSDFDQYVCGKFYAKKLERGQSAVFFDSDIHKENLKTLQAIVEDSNASASSYVKSMKKFYDSCLNLAAIEEAGMSGFVCSAQGLAWPTLEGWDWCQEDAFSFTDLTTQYARLFFSPFFGLDLKLDVDGTSRYVIHISESPETSDKIINFETGRQNPNVNIYEKYLVEVAQALGADYMVAANDVQDVVDLLIELAQIRESVRTTIPNNEDEEITMMELGDKYPILGLARTIREFFAAAEKGVFDFQKVILSSRQAQFFRRLQPLLADADSRILQNFFSFEYARSRVLITRNLREITLKLEKSLYGRLEEERRSLMCARETAKYYRAALAKQFVQKKFSEKSKKYVGEMFERIKDAYSETFDSWTWMSGPTKSLAREKLDEMLTMLGYRAVDRSERDLQFLYRNYPKGDEGYYKTRQDLYHADKTNWLKNLNEIFDLSFTRNLSPTDYRASYLLNNNLVMSAAYLQKPRFSLTYSTAHNFAVLGYLLGHHVSQAFDSDGRSVGRCNKRQVWWEDQEISTYTQKSQCYMDDYTGFLDSEFGSNVQLNRSVSEKTLLADNVGLHLAHRAWKTFVASNGTEKMLPGINLNQDETFFVTFAQQFCEKKTEEEAKKTLESDTLSAKFRILGPLRNFPEFGETFNCPVGSAMNPTQKCQF